MLWEEFLEPVIMMDKKTVSDGAGGTVTKWTDGAEFQAAIVFNSSMEARVGEKMGVTSLYTVTTPKNAKLEYHDVFRRLSDGKIFRVTSDGDDVHTPKHATFEFWQVTAEEFVPA